MKTPVYVRRFARLPAVFELLAAHPDGLSLAELARRFGIAEKELREDLLAFFAADPGDALLGLSRPEVLEFLGDKGDETDPSRAEIVRIVDERPTEELGVEYVDASELALVYTAAMALLDMQPDDEDLAGAVDVLTKTMYGEAAMPTRARTWTRPLKPLKDAVSNRQRARINYSRAWRAGLSERVIEPYRLVQTRRGWEVDAGPPDEDGSLRTFLLANIRSCEVLDEYFEPPADLDALIVAQRTTTSVQVRIPHGARWAADMYAEQVCVVADDEETVTLDLELLPPLEHRLGLFLLAAGPDSRVLDPPGLITSVVELARTLLEHHRDS